MKKQKITDRKIINIYDIHWYQALSAYLEIMELPPMTFKQFMGQALAAKAQILKHN